MYYHVMPHCWYSKTTERVAQEVEYTAAMAGGKSKTVSARVGMPHFRKTSEVRECEQDLHQPRVHII